MEARAANMRKEIVCLVCLLLLLVITVAGCGKPGYVIYNPGGFNVSGFDIENREKAIENIVGKFETMLPSKPTGLIMISEDPDLTTFVNIIYDKLVSHGSDIKIIREKEINKFKGDVDYLLYVYPVVFGERHIFSFLVPPPMPQDDNGKIVWQFMMEGWGIRSLLGASAEGRGSTVQVYMRLEMANTGEIEMIEDKGPKLKSTAGKEIKL